MFTQNGMCLQECFVQGSVEQLTDTIGRMEQEIEVLRDNLDEVEKRAAAAEQVSCIRSKNFVSIKFCQYKRRNLIFGKRYKIHYSLNIKEIAQLAV